MTRAKWDRQIVVLATGSILTSKHLARHMVARGQGGRMVNISSLSGSMGRVRGATHCVSKVGVNLLTKVLATELAQHRINVNAVAPGLVDMPARRDEATLSLAYRQSYVKMIPSGRMRETHEIARVVMLLSPMMPTGLPAST